MKQFLYDWGFINLILNMGLVFFCLVLSLISKSVLPEEEADKARRQILDLIVMWLISLIGTIFYIIFLK